MGIFKLRTIGQGHFDVHFTPDIKSGFRTTLGFECDLADDKTDYEFKNHGICKVDDCCQMSGVPTNNERFWTFTTSSSGINLDCNGLKVMSLQFSSLGDCLTAELRESITSFFSVSRDDRVTANYMVVCKLLLFISVN